MIASSIGSPSGSSESDRVAEKQIWNGYFLTEAIRRIYTMKAQNNGRNGEKINVSRRPPPTNHKSRNTIQVTEAENIEKTGTRCTNRMPNGKYSANFSSNMPTYSSRRASKMYGNKDWSSRRSSIDCCYSLKTESTQIYPIGRRNISPNGHNNLRIPIAKLESAPEKIPDTVLPPLVNKLPISSLTLETRRTAKSGRVRRRINSDEQNIDASKPPSVLDSRRSSILSCSLNIEEVASVNRRSSTSHLGEHQHVNTKVLKRVESRGSLTSGRMSQRSGCAGNNAFSADSARETATSRTFASTSRSSNSFMNSHQQHYIVIPSSKSSENDTGVRSTPEPKDSPGVLHSIPTGVPKHKMRSNGVCSPSSAGSGERTSLRQRFSARRRTSLPSGNMNDPTNRDVVKSQEFSLVVSDLQQETSKQQRCCSEYHSLSVFNLPDSSSKDLMRHESLQKIEEVHSDLCERGQPCDQKDEDRNEESLETNVLPKKIPESLQTPSRKEGWKKYTKPEESATNENLDLKAEQTNGQSSENMQTSSKRYEKPQVKKSFFSIDDTGTSASKKVTSRLEQVENISSTEENRHFVSEIPEKKSDAILQGSTFLEDHFLLDDESDLIDSSIIFEEDDHLCDDDFFRKRIIVWLMDVQTGQEAEQTVRSTPPPTPDLETQETAILVVYKGDQG